MRLIQPDVQLIKQEPGLDGVYKQIELCGRTCYKSEDKITDGSAVAFVQRMIKSNHMAMLEHGTVYLAMNPETIFPIEANDWGRYYHNPYSVSGKTCEVNGVTKVAVTTNLRVIAENDWWDDLKYICEPTQYHARRITLKFTCDRINSQSITRHRKDSFAQESQRFCDYLAGKFGMSVTYVEPSWIKEEDYEEFKRDLEANEQLYFKWRKKGYPPEEARYFLINGTKTEICVTGFESDWRHFFDLRLRGTTGRPHPDMLVLAKQAWEIYLKGEWIE